MLTIINDMVEAKLFTCEVYGNYPFKDLLKQAEVLKPIPVTIASHKAIGLLELIRYIRYRPHAVIIFGIEGMAGLIIYFVSRLLGAKTLVVVEENNITRLNNSFLRLLQRIKIGVIKLVYNHSHVLVCESFASKRYVLEILNIRRKTPPVVLVHGVNIKRFSRLISMPREHAKKNMLKVLGLWEGLLNKKWCVFIEELSYCKGADVLLDAIEIIQEICNEVNVVFLLPISRLLHDKVELKNTYKKKLARYVARGMVALYSYLRHEDIPLLYRASDVVVLPSRFLEYASSDRSPNVAIEALASGSVLVATYAGGIPTIVGDAAVLIKPNDPHALAEKLCHVLSNLEEYRYLEKKAYERAVKELDLKRYVCILLKLLIEATKSRV
jgi:glycosyltransferase involved in cell wall biosynthesis